MSTDWGTRFFKEKKTQLEQVQKVDSRWGVSVFHDMFGYAKALAGRDEKEAKLLNQLLETYVNEISKTGDVLQSYTKEEQAKSDLYKEVMLGFVASQAWVKNIKAGKVPRDMRDSLRRKTARLQTYVALEINEKLSDASRAFDLIVKGLKESGDAKHPLVLYSEGKKLVKEAKWIEAKTVFLTYEKHMKEKDPRCRKPTEDNCYFYLSFIQAKMDAASREIVDPVLSCYEPRENVYEKRYQEWIKMHAPSAAAIHSMKGIGPLHKEK